MRPYVNTASFFCMIIGSQTDVFWGQPEGQMFWSSEDRVRARFHYAESRQNKPQVNLWRKSLMKYGLWPEIIIFNQNPCTPCVPWIFLVAYGKMFWSSEDRVRARFHYAESRQNKPQVNLLWKSFLRCCLRQEIICNSGRQQI